MSGRTMDQIIREEARLIILRALAMQVDERLGSPLLGEELAHFGITRDRAWVHTELAWLQEAGAVVVTEAGSIRVAQLTERGARHLARAFVIEGVKRPSRQEG